MREIYTSLSERSFGIRFFAVFTAIYLGGAILLAATGFFAKSIVGLLSFSK